MSFIKTTSFRGLIKIPVIIAGLTLMVGKYTCTDLLSVSPEDQRLGLFDPTDELFELLLVKMFRSSPSGWDRSSHQDAVVSRSSSSDGNRLDGFVDLPLEFPFCIDFQFVDQPFVLKSQTGFEDPSDLLEPTVEQEVLKTVKVQTPEVFLDVHTSSSFCFNKCWFSPVGTKNFPRVNHGFKPY